MKLFFPPITVACVLLSFNVSGAVLYVDVNNTSPASPYTNWTTAATNIQDAVDAANPGDTVRVTNGIYQTGGRVVYGSLTNRVAVTRALTVQSINGPLVTTIKGYRVPGTTNGDTAIRCVYLTNGAFLSGFTLTNGATRSTGDAKLEQSGGGIWCESGAIITNCTLTGNAAANDGGGAYSGSFYDSRLTGNLATYGAGAYGSFMTNCTLTGNSASQSGGGVGGGTTWNCTLTSNTAFYSGGGAWSGELVNCTVTGNSTPSYGGGAALTVLFGCTLTGNFTSGQWGTGGGAYNGPLYNCTLTNNSSTLSGGGADSANLNNCIVAGNSARHGGGVYSGTHQHCIFTGNTAGDYGGGALYANLYYCTLTNNSAAWGGGSYAGSLYYCALIANSVTWYGGGAYSSTLLDCVLAANSSAYGGGAYYSTLYNCTLVANSASATGGGCYRSTNHNCIIYFNNAGNSPNCYSGVVNYCCTTPLPGGTGNLTNAPLFINQAAGNYRLSSNSPCINAGENSSTGSFDLDGRTRIAGGTVDLGTYEFQGPGMGEFIGWLQQLGLPTDGTADYTDTDGDGINNWQEYLADTSPLDANDFLHITSFTRSGTYNQLWWASKSTRLYQVQRRQSFDAASSWETIITNATPGWNNVGFDNMGPQYFYRIQAVQP
jgi:hypothetical protein